MRKLLPVFLLASPGVSAALQEHDGPRFTPDPAILALLEETSERGARSEVAARQLANEASSFEALFHVLSAGEPGGAEDYTVTLNLDTWQRETLIGAMTVHPDALSFLQSWQRAPHGHAQSLAFFRIMSGLARPEELFLLFAEAATGLEAERYEGELELAFEEALTGLFTRDAEALQRLRRSWHGYEVECLPAALRALQSSPCPEGVGFLADILGWKDSVDPHVIVAIGELAPLLAGETRRRLADDLRDYLDHESISLQKLTISTLGILGDPYALPRLIDRLRHPRAGMRATTLRAVRAISRRNFPATPEIWEAWYEREREWFESRAPRLLEDLEATAPETVLRAIQEISRHGLHHEELTDALVQALYNPDARVRISACRAHARLGGDGGLSALSELLNDPHDDVVAAAWAALKQITGEELPPERELWDARLVAFVRWRRG